MKGFKQIHAKQDEITDSFYHGTPRPCPVCHTPFKLPKGDSYDAECPECHTLCHLQLYAMQPAQWITVGYLKKMQDKVANARQAVTGLHYRK